MAKTNRQSAIGNRQFKQLVRHLLRWFSRNARDLPWRRTRNPYAIWVSEIMLQQTQVKTVIPYWERWMRELPTVEAVAKASPDKIHKLWEGLGYYIRARNLQKAAKQIITKRRALSHDAQKNGDSQSSSLQKNNHCRFPEDFEDVLALPGIGRYTAGAICSIAFNQPTPILDGNVIRVLTRIFGIAENPRNTETNAQLWKLAEDLVSLAKVQRRGETTGEPAREDARPTKNKNCSTFNQSLMELGAVVCTPQNPQCLACPVKRLCVAFRDNRVAELPNPGKRQAATARRFAAFVVKWNGRFLVRRRPAGVVNAHLWEFPNVEIGARLSEPQHAHLGNANSKIPATNAIPTRCGSKDPRSDPILDAARQTLGIAPLTLKPLCRVKHSITRYRITLEAFCVNFGGASYTSPHPGPARSGTRITRPSEIGIWKTPMQMEQLAFTAAHGKILAIAVHHGPASNPAGR